VAETALPLVLPEPPKLKEESAAFVLGDGDIEDLATAPPRRTANMRPLAQPMAFAPSAEPRDPLLDEPEIADDEPTKVGSPTPAALARAREEGLAMLRERELAEARAAAEQPLAMPEPPPPAARTTAPLAVPKAAVPFSDFGKLDLSVTAPLAAPPLAQAPSVQAPAGSTTAPIPAAFVSTERLPRAAVAPALPVLIDVTPLTLAVETVEGFCDAIIERNTTVPCSRTREFVTAADNQTSVRVRVSQGESKKFIENTLLGEIELSGLRPARRGDVRIAVSFALDSSGMLVVGAKDVGTGRETSTQVHLVGLPNAQEVARMAARQAARGV
jgi:molecular chaperone DnaK